jgi:hypothetical protein
MAKTQTRHKPPKRASQGRTTKKPPAPWYERYPLLPWIFGIGILALVMFVLRSDGSDAPAPGESVARPVVGGDLHSLVVDPSDSDTIYVGSHEGVSVSTDGGASWEVMASLEGADAMGWAFTDDAIFVGGHPGLSVSTDGGETFEVRNEGLVSTDVHALGAGEDVVYVGLAGLGTFASTDGGATWEERNDRMGGAFMGRIVVDPADDDHIIAPDMESGVVESTDGGRSWDPLNVQGVSWVSWDASDRDRIIVTAQGEAAESTDGGGSWDTFEVPDGVTFVEISPHDPGLLVAAALEAPEAVVYVSTDGGATWAQP